ncbi:hypothetical protein [Rhizobium sp. BK176]|uniref:hypothetical protein n=1 Tax=Rhizobium sp. BK176 TaxID=2587071 RepID=UPI002169C213|nr:hypothetical protein [Rhizobium sp. BK176]MCS4088949.1 hypothetical protein [Rhizobium sp. BK176]
MSVSIRIPFTFEADVIFKRKRKATRSHFVGEAEFAIRSVSEGEATEVVTWKRFFTSFFLNEEANFSGQVTGNNAIRLVDGRFYRPAIENRHVGSYTLPADTLVDRSGIDMAYRDAIKAASQLAYLGGPKSNVHSLTGFLQGKASRIDDFEITQVLSSQENERREELRQRVENLISIGGLVYEKVEEPVIALSTDKAYLDLHVGQTHYGSVVNGPSRLFATSPARMMFFPVDQLENARSIAAGLGMQQGWETPSYALVAPQAMSFDRVRDVASRTIDFIVDRHSSLIGDLDGPGVAAFLELKDRSECLRNLALVNPDADEAFGAIERFLDQASEVTPPAVLDEYDECVRIYEQLTGHGFSRRAIGGPTAGP